MHVQVVIRFFSSVPGVPWFVAYLPMRNEEKREGAGRDWAKWWVYYSVVYSCVGTVLFANFYPPA